MSYIELTKLTKESYSNIIIMIFAEGTILKPKSWFTLFNHKSYIPIGNCISIIGKWSRQGAEIVYCTSRKGKQAKEIAGILSKYKFHGTKLYYREKGEKYKNIIERVKPNILIEDDCRSIGGNWQMCITYVEPQLKNSIKSIVVNEFKGIDKLPQSIFELQQI